MRAAWVRTVRSEAKPGHQLQVDFGEKKMRLSGSVVTVFQMVAVFSFSRGRLVRVFLSQRGDDWRHLSAQFGTKLVPSVLGRRFRADRDGHLRGLEEELGPSLPVQKKTRRRGTRPDASPWKPTPRQSP
ncbi:hypothetical protein HUW63_04780 [Myxococcus sp. AM001]|nr:hypothetical protein [Myxococcus sp. AM001]